MAGILLLRQFEVQRDSGLHGRGASIHAARLESPLLHRTNGRLRQFWRPADQLYILHCAISANAHVEYDRPLNSLPSRVFRILWLDAVKQCPGCDRG